MLQIFGGMIIGSMMIMVLLGGGSAGGQVFSNIQQLYFQNTHLNTTTTFLLIGIVSVFLGVLSLWPAKAALNPKQVIRGLRRHCS